MLSGEVQSSGASQWNVVERGGQLVFMEVASCSSALSQLDLRVVSSFRTRVAETSELLAPTFLAVTRH